MNDDDEDEDFSTLGFGPLSGMSSSGGGGSSKHKHGMTSHATAAADDAAARVQHVSSFVNVFGATSVYVCC